MKDKLISAIREVPISGKTYEEYIEAIADRLIAEDYRKELCELFIETKGACK